MTPIALLHRESAAASIEVGNTPLLVLRRLFPSERVRIAAKAEWHNPGGSVKDRAALSMVKEGERAGRLAPGKRILDATSGNTGIAYAWIGARLGIRVRLCVPKSINDERRKVLEAYGAELILTDPLEGSDGAIRMARKLYEENPDEYFYPDQYNNPANWRAHYETTAREIWGQVSRLNGRVSHFIAGLGTSGTFTGTGRRLRELNPSVRLISMQPDAPLHGLEGLKHMATSIQPGIYDPGLADENLFVSTEEAQEMVVRLAREEGVLAGISGGANVAAALRVARRVEQEGDEAFIVTVLPDSGERYLEDSFWRNP
jgi:S-sulfo-L-cysteine synthase (O-acetyl-L-serine-dependent)